MYVRLNPLLCPSNASAITMGKMTRPNRGAEVRSPHELINNTDTTRCPEAAIAARDVLFIDRDGRNLSPANSELARLLSRRAIRELLELDTVRTAFLGEKQNQINYRPVPHDCLLHFSGAVCIALSLNSSFERKWQEQSARFRQRSGLSLISAGFFTPRAVSVQSICRKNWRPGASTAVN